MTLDEAIQFLEPETGNYSQAMLAIAKAVKALQPCEHESIPVEYGDGLRFVKCGVHR